MSKLPRFQSGQIIKGSDLNLLMAALDSGGVIDQNSITSSGTTGSGLTSTFPNVTGSTSPSPGSANAPATPTGLSARSGIDNFAQSHTSYVVLTWTPNPVVDFVSRYDVYWHKGVDSAYHNITVSGDVNSVRVNDVFPGTTYSFAVQAHDAANRASLWSPELNVIISQDADPPAVPTGLSATSSAGGVYLNWNEVGSEGISNDLKQYQIAISLDGGATYPYIDTIGPGNSFLYTPLTGAQGTVFFKIATVDWTGNVSAFSSAVSAAVGIIQGPLLIENGTSINVELLRIGRVNPIGTGTQPNYGGILFFSGGPAPGASFDSDNSDPIAMARYNVSANSSELRMGMGDDPGSAGDAFAIGTIGTTTFSSWAEKHRFDAAGRYTSAGGITVTAGDLNMTAGNIVGPANFAIYSGTGDMYVQAESGGTHTLWLRGAAGSGTGQVGVSTGAMTLSAPIKIPPTAGGTISATSYGTVPVKITEVVLGSATATVTVSSIPTGFRALHASGDVQAAGTGGNLQLQFNGDTGNNYVYNFIESNGTATLVGGSSGASAVGFIRMGFVNTGTTAAIHNTFDFWVPNYTGTTWNKTMHGVTTRVDTTAQNLFNNVPTGSWQSTAAITSIVLSLGGGGNLNTGSYVALYGEP